MISSTSYCIDVGTVMPSALCAVAPKEARELEESVARYLHPLDIADRQEPSEALNAKTSRLKEKIEKLKQEMRRRRRHSRLGAHPGR
jgi:hypothetical protein